MRLLRIMRGALGSAIVWGVGWVPLTLLVFGAIALVGGRVPPQTELASVVRQFAMLGAMSGAVFSVVLAVAARRRTFTELTLPGMLAYGAVGGMLLPAAITAMVALRIPEAVITPGRVVAQLMVTALLGGICAVSSLYVARRAPKIARSQSAALEGAQMPGRDLTHVGADKRDRIW